MNKLYEKCLRCNRKLKTEESKILGFGKVCWEKYNTEHTTMQLFQVNKESKDEKECGGTLIINTDDFST